MHTHKFVNFKHKHKMYSRELRFFFREMARQLEQQLGPGLGVVVHPRLSMTKTKDLDDIAFVFS